MSLLRANGGGLGGAGAPGGALGSFYSHSIDQSLKFNDDDSAYLNRTPSSAGNRKTFTFSCWVKRGNLGEQALLDAYSDDSNRTRLMFDAGNRLQFFTRLSGADHSLICNAVCRDLSAWYHVVFSVDTTQSTASNRVKIYINGESQTFTGTGYPDDEDTFINHTVAHSIGSANDSGGREIYFDGYLAEINMIDGTALTADSFGETKNGVWIAKEYSGSYGTNGFHLPFSVTQGNSVNYDAAQYHNITWTNASQYDIASDDDFCLEFFTKGNDFESSYSYTMGDYAVGGPHFMIQLGNSGNIYGYYGNGLANSFDASSYLTSTDWHHIAWVRESGTTRFYIDGVQRHTGTNGGSTAHNLSQFFVGDAYPAANAPHFIGSLSNLRLTIGAARYGSGTTFTVPTSTLTNDSSNVKLLVFTTSTLTADASSAGVTGSISEGVPVFRADNPFSTIIGKDAAGNNDFSDVALSFTDILPDNPTNNFPTFNPLKPYWANAPTLSEGNLKTRNASSEWKTLLGTMAVSSGKWYAEFLCSESSAGATSIAAIGILDIGANNAMDGSYFIGYEDNSVSYYGSNGYKFVSYTNTSTYATYGNAWGLGDIIGVALDLDAGTVKFYKNNTVQNSGTAAASSLSGTFVFGAAVYATSAIIANFGQDSSFAGVGIAQGNADGNGVGDFFYAPPSGHLAICSSNLPDAAIIDGTDHFNTVLWTGTGSGGTRAVSGVGFSPDWVWAKNLTQNYSHTLYDSVRGAGNDKEFQSNDTAAEGDGNNNQYGYLSAFDSDGFTSTSGSEGDANNLYFNESSKNYAAWNWKAGGATPTKTYTVKVVSDSGNKYRFDDFGTSAVTLNLQEGGTYTFDQSDSSNAGHPLRFSTTSDGTHGGGSEYTTGVTTTGTPGNAGAKTVITVAASAATLYYYCTQHSGMGGQANTNATFGSTNFDGSLLSTVSANTDAGFSIVSYSGSNSAGSFGHGLSQAVELVIIKQRNNASFWATGYNVPDWTWSSDYIQLQDDAQKGADGGSTIFTSAPSSTVVNIGGGSVTSTSGKNLIAYCFHSVEGYSKIGQYEGNNLADGTFVYTGFRPAFLLVKNLDAEAQWLLLDNKRDPYNVGANYTSPDIPNAFAAVSGGFYDLLSNGFKWRLGSGNLGSANAANTYVYYAVAEQPFKFANAR
tara:strand:+ start:6949 stop:10440 length:3492 start_codon:yes stop_codon:yes gene_type:complete